MGRPMNDARLFTSDEQRARAIEVRRLLLRLENGEGEDRGLGADVLDALAAPAEIGDVTGCMDCAYHLARHLGQSTLNLHVRVGFKMRERVDGGWKSAAAVTGADVARATTAIVLKVYLVKLERAPA
jgi:hypothetical protein